MAYLIGGSCTLLQRCSLRIMPYLGSQWHVLLEAVVFPEPQKMKRGKSRGGYLLPRGSGEAVWLPTPALRWNGRGSSTVIWH